MILVIEIICICTYTWYAFPLFWSSFRSTRVEFLLVESGRLWFYVKCALCCHCALAARVNSIQMQRLPVTIYVHRKYTRPAWIRLIYGLYGGTFARRRSSAILRVRKRERLPSITHVREVHIHFHFHFHVHSRVIVYSIVAEIRLSNWIAIRTIAVTIIPPIIIIPHLLYYYIFLNNFIFILINHLY